ncbi:hypothetical protein BPNPMPFG_006751 (plasmid) [Mesorhizobium sp. AR07]|uniref:Uncharacterized protein n=1 Tax=Mesorhizobium huakuii TaxID=28104 RepID=A0A7G6T5U5_9HYPH|nr:MULTISPECIES: hypothetical protein [Mesorhizobium]QND62127.1 hypothetical protein HB778_39325 [Mesorhizobium huakuii]QND69492.1 hypothetical protein HB777_38260 [Mesorhizobium loti]UVK49065.1 hypothetical protein BPNPMPFG_006751 [Mesorhizobium sp. AR07]
MMKTILHIRLCIMQVVSGGLKFATTVHNRQNVELFGAGWNWRLLNRLPPTGQLASLPTNQFIRRGQDQPAQAGDQMISVCWSIGGEL